MTVGEVTLERLRAVGSGKPALYSSGAWKYLNFEQSDSVDSMQRRHCELSVDFKSGRGAAAAVFAMKHWGCLDVHSELVARNLLSRFRPATWCRDD